MADFAPIVLFVYNRPWHTLQTLNALMKNELADQHVLYIYSDGPKIKAANDEVKKIEEVRKLIRTKQWCKEVYIVESETNRGLADSIINGVTEIVNKHGKIIVLEDDLITSAGFLNYMNIALNLYKNEKNVMHISGYMFPTEKKLPETFFLVFTSCWGWGTWDRAWQSFDLSARNLLSKVKKQVKYLKGALLGKEPI